MLKRIIDEKLFHPRGVHGFFPANRVGDDIEVYTDESRTEIKTLFHFLRQQPVKNDGSPNRSSGGTRDRPARYASDDRGDD